MRVVQRVDQCVLYANKYGMLRAQFSFHND